MKYSITGDNLQFVHVEIAPGELVWGEAGSMVYFTGNVQMEAKARGGLMGGLKRVLTQESFFVTEFTADGGPGVVAFAGRVPGRIAAIELQPGKNWIFQKDAFLAAGANVTFDVAFQKRLGSILFGGEGLILQRFYGEGTLWVHSPGDLAEYNLAAGQTMKISSGHVVGWEDTVAFDIQTVGGLKTAFFGGEGLFITTLTGPGKILMQSMTVAKLASALVPYLPHQSSGGPSINFGGR
jgi:uncharacterized protein (TIGR00266 family)